MGDIATPEEVVERAINEARKYEYNKAMGKVIAGSVLIGSFSTVCALNFIGLIDFVNQSAESKNPLPTVGLAVLCFATIYTLVRIGQHGVATKLGVDNV